MKLLISAVAVLATMCASSANAAWPDDKPIEVVVGFAAGGGTDIMARKLVQGMQKRLGKAQFVVLNKAGASGELAWGYTAKAQPDGYTIAVVNVPSFTYLPMIRNTQYQVADFQLIGRMVDDPTVLITQADNKVDSLKAVLDLAKQKSTAPTVGHNGEGSNGELVVQLLHSVTGNELFGAAYRGTGPQKIDVLGNHLKYGTVSAGEIPELHKGQKAPIKALVQFTPKRSAALPDVPTATEAGINVLMTSERGLAAPKGVPADILKRLETAMGDTLKDPEFVGSAGADAAVIAFMPGAQWSLALEASAVGLKKIAAERK